VCVTLPLKSPTSTPWKPKAAIGSLKVTENSSAVSQ